MAMSSPQASRLRQGRSLFHQGKYREAADIFNNCLDAEPDNVAALAGLGLSCSRIGEHDRAVGLLTRASNLRPGSPAVHFARGLVCHSAGDRTAAQAEFDRVLELQSDHVLARRWRLRVVSHRPVETQRIPDLERLIAEEEIVAEPARPKGKIAPPEAADAESVSAETVEEEAVAAADDAEAAEADEAADQRWPGFDTIPLKKGDAWGGLKVSRCEKDLLVVAGARHISFQKKDPNVVEKTFLGLFKKKMSAKNWTTLRISFKQASKKSPEKAVLEFLDNEGETRLTLPGGKTADGKALYGIRAAVHLARIFNLDIQVEGEPEEGGDELMEAISQLS